MADCRLCAALLQTLWPYLLHYPKDEIAVVDALCMVRVWAALARHWLPRWPTGLRVASLIDRRRSAALLLQVHKGSAGEGRKAEAAADNYRAAQQGSPFQASAMN